MRRENAMTLGAVTLAVVLCLAGAYLTDSGEDDSRFDAFPVPVTDDMRDWMPAAEARSMLDTSLDRLTSTMSSDPSHDDVSDAVGNLESVYDSVMTDYVFVGWDHDRDPASYGDEYVQWETLVGTADILIGDAYREALTGPHGDVLADVLGADRAEAILSEGPVTPEELELIGREAELIAEYSAYTGSDPEVLADIYLEMVDVRNGIAVLNGYADYAEYAYAEVYLRDYTPDDVAAMQDILGDGRLAALDLELYGMWADHDFTYTYTDQDDLFDTVGPFIGSVCPEFAELYDHMRTYRMMDFEDVDTKLPVAYTGGYGGVVHIFADPTGDVYDVATLVHEFGHAANMALVSEPMGDIDICEVQSQGLEVLLAADPSAVMGEESDMYTLMTVSDRLLYIMEGLVMDAFERAVYSGDCDDASDLEELYESVAEDYGYGVYHGWYEVPHGFIAPMYYISYAVSAFGALDVFLEAVDDYDSAVETYLDVVAYRGTGYIGMADELGMTCMFDEADLDAMVGSLGEWAASREAVPA